MPNQQAIDYAKQQLQQGTNKKEIKKALLSSGWQEKDINEAFNQASDFNNQQTQSVLPTSNTINKSALSSVGTLLIDTLKIYKEKFLFQ